MAANLVIVSLCIACVFGQALGQSVSSRSASPDETRLADPEASSGQARSLYSQNRISPHRMMHFGKRPVVPIPPGLAELNSSEERQPRSQRSVGSVANFPYSLYFDLANNRVLEPVVEAEGISANQHRREQHLAELIEHVLEENRRKDYGQQKQKRLNQQPLSDWTSGNGYNVATGGNQQQSYYTNEPAAFKMMRLIDAEGENAFGMVQPGTLFNIQGGAGKNKKQSSKLVDEESSSSSSSSSSSAGNDKQEQQAASTGGEVGAKQQTNDEQVASNGSAASDGEQQQQQVQQQDDSNINIVGRSGVPIHMAQGDDLMSKLMHAQVVNKILFGRPIAVEQHASGGSYRNLGNFIKKAEPQRMTFMHFG